MRTVAALVFGVACYAADTVHPKTVAPAAKAAAVAPDTSAAKSTKKSESLDFAVNWPSGLSLGEGKLISSFDGQKWSFRMNVEAAIPAFAVAEAASSTATADLCSLTLDKEATRGKRKVAEKTTFDSSKLTATRQTKDGGKSEMRVGGCARDALTFIQFLRRELAAGRLPSGQPVYYGAGYTTRVQYTGAVRVVRDGQYVEADKLQANVRGPASEFALELLFLRDAERTPFQVLIPVSVGKFTVEFSR